MTKIKPYDFAKRPRKPSAFLMTIARWFAMAPRMLGRKHTKIKINMDGIKPPYLLLATHASLLDFPVMYRAVAPYNANNVAAIDGFRDYSDFLMRRLGCICKRKFVQDYYLIKNLRYCVDKYRGIVCMYPEARYSLDGTTSYLPNSLGKLCKFLKVPVVVLRLYGTFISAPQWNKREQKLPLRSELECIATAEEVQNLPFEELNARIQKAMARDDYAYQREHQIKNTYPQRAAGLHHILYQCPHCYQEFAMYSAGTTISCQACGKSWSMDEYGTLQATTGETEFTHIPDWTRWERANVRQEVRSGQYHFKADVDVYTLPNAKRFYKHGMGKLEQTVDGTHFTGTAYGEKVDLHWAATALESMHIEYAYPLRKMKGKRKAYADFVDLSVRDESYWLHPVGLRDQLTKLSFATEEIYFLACEKLNTKN